MKQKKVIFRDTEIVEFCRATHDTNVIHEPLFMANLGKRVIVPGMFALSQTVNMSGDFLKNHARSLKVLFNSLLSSGDFVTLSTSSCDGNPIEIMQLKPDSPILVPPSDGHFIPEDLK